MSIENIFLEKIAWTTEKALFFNDGKNDSETKFTNDMWTFPGMILKKKQNFEQKKYLKVFYKINETWNHIRLWMNGVWTFPG